MKYIKKIILENFQSHKYTTLEFDKQLNVIVGPSDQGKTAIIRAIKWVLYNEPSGNYFIRQGEKECVVTIFFDNHVILKRIKSSSKNLYILHDSDGQEFIYEGFGRNVPMDIIEKMNIKKLDLDINESTSINIGEQLEGPFLLSKKTSTRANAIGRLVGVHFVDKAVKDILRDIRNLQVNKKLLGNKLFELNKQLEKYEYLDTLKKNIEIIDELNQTAKQKRMKKLILEKLKKKHDSLILEKLKHEYLINNLKNLNMIETNLNMIENKMLKFNNLYIKRIGYVKNETEIRKNSILLSNTNKILKSEIYIEDAYEKSEHLNQIKKIRKNLQLIEKKRCYNLEHIEKLQNIDRIDKLLSSLCLKNNKLEKICLIKDKKNSVNKSLAKGLRFLKPFKNIVYIEQTVDEININLLNNLQLLKDKYAKIKEEQNLISDEVISMSVIIRKHIIRYNELLTKIEICPLCFNKINDEDIKRILKELGGGNEKYGK